MTLQSFTSNLVFRFGYYKEIILKGFLKKLDNLALCVRNLGSRFLQGKGNRGNVEDEGLTCEC